MAKRLTPDQLGDDRIDDRWTLDKLARAGYEYSGERGCRECHEPVAFYKKPSTSLSGRDVWLVLDPVTLEPHACQP